MSTEALVTVNADWYAALSDEIDGYKQRIKELEDYQTRFWEAQKIVLLLNAKLDAVKELPDKWRSVSVTIGWDMATNEHADELMEAIGEQE